MALLGTEILRVLGISASGQAAGEKEVAMNGSTTTGGFIGDELEFQDIAANLWQVNGITKSTGTAATPFSTSAT